MYIDSFFISVNVISFETSDLWGLDILKDISSTRNAYLSSDVQRIAKYLAPSGRLYLYSVHSVGTSDTELISLNSGMEVPEVEYNISNDSSP